MPTVCAMSLHALCSGLRSEWCASERWSALADARSPVHPHRRANDVFPLFGTLLFGLFAFYLQLAVVKGNFKFGLNLLLFRVHPMRPGATLMSSFLFNVALILLATTATIQFCAAAFQLYADGTAVLDIFGNQLTSIQARGGQGVHGHGRRHVGRLTVQATFR